MSRHIIIAVFLVLILLAAGAGSSLHAQVQKTIPASMDNTIYEESDSLSNGAGRHMFVGRTKDGHIRRALIHFPIADSLPPGAVIQSVAVVLYMSRTTAGAETISIHRVLSAWGEGGSAAPGEEGGGAPASASGRRATGPTDRSRLRMMSSVLSPVAASGPLSNDATAGGSFGRSSWPIRSGGCVGIR